MKKTLIGLAAALLLAMTPGFASATLFQVSDTSTLNINVSWGWVDYDYQSLGSSVFDLDAGESTPTLNLYQLTINSALGSGTAQANVYLSMPGVNVNNNSGSFRVVGLLNVVLGKLTWASPEITFSYGNGGQGTLTLDNLTGINFGCPIYLTGKITNKIDPVPEPSTMLLLAIGFAGTVACRMRKKASH